MNVFRKIVVNILATTALTLIILGIFGTAMGGSVLFLNTIFQSLAANILIHVGLKAVRLIESRFILVDLLIEIGYVLLVLIPFGFVFDWYNSTPLWLVLLMGVGIYLIGSAINIIKINKDIEDINAELSNLHLE